MSKPSSGASTPNPRFTMQTKTAEDLLSKQTEGLVALSDFRKRRAEVHEQRERDFQELLIAGNSGRSALTDGTVVSAMKAPAGKKKKRKIGAAKLSFEVEADGDAADGKGTRSVTLEGAARTKIGVNASVAIAPKALTKSALSKESQARETLRKEFIALQEAVKSTEIVIPFVFYDGTNTPGGTCTMKKGDFIWAFLDRSRKTGAQLRVGEKMNSRKDWARIGVDDLMLVRGSLIIPHHYDFYYFIINHIVGPNNRILFDYSCEPPTNTAPAENGPLNLDNSLPRPTDQDQVSLKVMAKAEPEGKDDDPTLTKVVDRRWYERNKHIFPASVWQEFDPEKDYQHEVKRDLGGNAFFFS